MFKVDLYISRYCCRLRSSSRPKSLSRIFWWTISCGVSSNTDPGRALDCNHEVREKLWESFGFQNGKRSSAKKHTLDFSSFLLRFCSVDRTLHTRVSMLTSSSSSTLTAGSLITWSAPSTFSHTAIHTHRRQSENPMSWTLKTWDWLQLKVFIMSHLCTKTFVFS